MGIINHGILGGFSGKVGPIVGFRWKSNYYIRSRAAKSAILAHLNNRHNVVSFPRFSVFLKQSNPSYDLVTRSSHKKNLPLILLCPIC